MSPLLTNGALLAPAPASLTLGPACGSGELQVGKTPRGRAAVCRVWPSRIHVAKGQIGGPRAVLSRGRGGIFLFVSLIVCLAHLLSLMVSWEQRGT